VNRNIQGFTNSLDALNIEVKEHYEKLNIPEENFVCDGVINTGEYFASPLKILWILKEPYTGAGKTMVEDLNTNRADGNKKDSQTTWHPIIYISHGITNNFEQYNSMKKIQEDKSISKVLRKIAFINVQKTPAKTRTNPKDITEAYQINKEILHRQINVINPDIIIGANTLHLFVNDFGLKDEHKIKHHWTKNNKLYIKTYHPGQTILKRDDYINRVINIAKYWDETRNK
jgi:hypothetical protein